MKHFIVFFLLVPILLFAQKDSTSVIVNNTEKNTNLTRGEIIGLAGLLGLINGMTGITAYPDVNGDESLAVDDLMKKITAAITSTRDSTKTVKLFFTAIEARNCALLLSEVKTNLNWVDTRNSIQRKLAVLFANPAPIANNRKK